SANDLKLSLEFKNIEGLFSAGQFNGSSGYEEGAAQGLIARINAARKILGKDPLILDRSEAYIGVLIDDLVTKDNTEPYRMMTSRAEYRLLLRQDNADLRLTEIGHEVGLISDERYNHVLEKKRLIEEEVKRVKEVYVGAGAFISEFLTKHDSTPLKTAASIADLIRRPELGYDVLAAIDTDRPDLPREVTEQVEIYIKYEGYIERQQKQVEDFKKIEKRLLPTDIDYTTISGLRLEAQQKLNKYKPASIGQASRLSGVTPADISVLLVASEQIYKMRKEKEE
nr:tRNA uridine-5-carboxymethylaminomethyl(34) synthesis enzyme MnmG [Lachnospiraceae bacterium]